MDKKLSKLIRQKRKKKKMSQRDLALALGYPNAQIVSNIERGICSLPIKRFKQTSEILSVDLKKIKSCYLKDVKMDLDRTLNG